MPNLEITHEELVRSERKVIDWYRKIMERLFPERLFYWIRPTVFQPWLSDSQYRLLEMLYGFWMCETARLIESDASRVHMTSMFLSVDPEVIEHALMDASQLPDVLEALSECGYHGADPVSFMLMAPEEDDLVFAFSAILPISEKQARENSRRLQQLKEQERPA